MSHPQDVRRRQAMRQPRPVQQDTEDEDAIYSTRLPSSTRRYANTEEQGVVQRPRYDVEVYQRYQLGRRTPVPPRRSSMQAPPVPARQRKEPPPRRARVHWLVYVGVGMLAAILLVILVSVALGWWQKTQENWTYGNPRTYQCDAVVGHHDSQDHPSHFIAVNLDGHIDVIEFPGGDATHAKAYLVTQVLQADAQDAPATLSFQDVTGNGTLAMLVHVGGQTLAFLNDQGTFRPATANDHLTL